MVRKILIIRLNSIGDIVLTSPVIRSLFEKGHEVHFLLKKAYVPLVEFHPCIKQVWTYEKDDNKDLIRNLQKEDFDVVVDLHNNVRSWQIKRALKSQNYTLSKPRIKYFLMEKFGLKVSKQKHIVERYLDVIKSIAPNSERHLEIFTGNPPMPINLPQTFVALAIGAAFFTKQIPVQKLLSLIEACSLPILLLGDQNDKELAKQLLSKSNKSLVDLTGELSILQSAEIVRKAKYLMTGDTGLMHIAAAFQTPVLSIFGSTHPVLGYTPYDPLDKGINVIVENENCICRPCTKQGRHSCPKGHFECMDGLTDRQLKDGVLNMESQTT